LLPEIGIYLPGTRFRSEKNVAVLNSSETAFRFTSLSTDVFDGPLTEKFLSPGVLFYESNQKTAKEAFSLIKGPEKKEVLSSSLLYGRYIGVF